MIRVGCTGAVLALLLTGLRAQILFGWSDLRRPLELGQRLAVAAYADLAYVAVLALAVAALCRLAVGQTRLRRAMVALFTVAACLSLVLGFVNVRAVSELGRPINYQWLYYSHFMRSLDTYTALATLLSWKWVGAVAAACVVLLLLSELLARGIRRVVQEVGSVRFGVALAGGMSAYFALAWPAHSRLGGTRATLLENPVVSLVASVLTADANPVLAEMPTHVGWEDFLTASERGAEAPETPFTARARAAGVRNVLVVVLESVGAQYVSGFGGPAGATPELDYYQRDARRFTNFYAQQPSTTHSLVALLLSVHPPHTFRTLTREHADIDLPSWSGELKRRGYRTAFINADDNRFQRADAFLARRQFDLMADGWTSPCTEAEVDSSGSDECMMRTLTTWVEREPSRPFFAVVWTIQTHFPYSVSPSAPAIAKPSPLSETDGHHAPDSMATRFERYLRALRESDRSIGKLLRHLARHGLLDSTLVVVVGDHGEAFGQHGNAFHRYLYEEEVHVPLLLINRRLFHDETDEVTGSIVDLAPTIMDLLGYPIPAEWQGRTLFTRERSGRVYLFGPYSGLFGYREGNRKLIYDAIGDETELYDLAADPREVLNLAAAHPEVVREGRERLAAWMQYQNRFYRRVLQAGSSR
ncbi:MAG: sulfatase-like hydrolase/transferase [Gemmatimonadales bacterium]|nr:sulfatase-like hydrolase/transferase [Gemmatimonadales bacterium]